MEIFLKKIRMAKERRGKRMKEEKIMEKWWRKRWKKGLDLNNYVLFLNFYKFSDILLRKMKKNKGNGGNIKKKGRMVMMK